MPEPDSGRPGKKRGVRSGGKPGELRLLRREEILRQGAGPRLSPHDPDLGEALVTAELAAAAAAPEIWWEK